MWTYVSLFTLFQVKNNIKNITSFQKNPSRKIYIKNKQSSTLFFSKGPLTPEIYWAIAISIMFKNGLCTHFAIPIHSIEKNRNCKSVINRRCERNIRPVVRDHVMNHASQLCLKWAWLIDFNVMLKGSKEARLVSMKFKSQLWEIISKYPQRLLNRSSRVLSAKIKGKDCQLCKWAIW